MPEPAQFQEAASSLTEAAHQIETRVDDTPGQIAAKRSQDHGLDVRAPRGSKLSVPVLVRTMISPNKTSEILSMGSRTE